MNSEGEQQTPAPSAEERWRAVQAGEQKRIFRIISTHSPEEASEILAQEKVESRKNYLKDEMTGLWTLAAGEAQLQRLAAHNLRHGNTPVSIISLDMDNFSEINNEQDHAQGDRAIGILAEVLKRAAREGDMPCRRYPTGDEFFVVLPSTGTEEAQVYAERIRAKIPETMNKEGFKGVTASIGVATLATDFTNIKSLLNDADVAQIAAKKAGKNRIVVYTSDLKSQAA